MHGIYDDLNILGYQRVPQEHVVQILAPIVVDMSAEIRVLARPRGALACHEISVVV